MKPPNPRFLIVAQYLTRSSTGLHPGPLPLEVFRVLIKHVGESWIEALHCQIRIFHFKPDFFSWRRARSVRWNRGQHEYFMQAVVYIQRSESINHGNADSRKKKHVREHEVLDGIQQLAGTDFTEVDSELFSISIVIALAALFASEILARRVRERLGASG